MAAGLDVQFYDTSTGAPVVWIWDFGDGSDLDFTQNPLHSFPAPDIYTVTLIVFSGAGTYDSTARDVDVTGDVYPAPAVFSVWNYGITDLEVKFFDHSYGVGGEYVTGWLWDFDDGQTSTEQNPTHTYAEPNAYQVSLQVTGNEATTDITFQTLYVDIPVITDWQFFDAVTNLPVALTSVEYLGGITYRATNTETLDDGGKYFILGRGTTYPDPDWPNGGFTIYNAFFSSAYYAGEYVTSDGNHHGGGTQPAPDGQEIILMNYVWPGDHGVQQLTFDAIPLAHP